MHNRMMVQGQQDFHGEDYLGYAPCEGGICIKSVGRFTIAAFGSFLGEASRLISTLGAGTVFIDLSESRYLDSTVLGSLVRINRIAKGKLVISSPSPDAYQAMDIMGLLSVLTLEDKIPPLSGAMVPFGSTSPAQADTVYTAHKLLMELSPQNTQKFAGLMEILRKERLP